MDRRHFLGASLGARALWAMRPRGGYPWRADPPALRLPPEVRANGLILTAAPGRPSPDGQRTIDAWLYNDRLPGPTIRMTRGEQAGITLRNALPEQTITHWHGLMVPESADGHPRLAIAPGAEYAYRFTVDQPAGLHWYHPHTHMRTGYQVHRGLAGLFIVDEPGDAARGLPARERELVLVIQDRTIAADGDLPYDLRGPSMMAGYFGDTLLVNGQASPRAAVDAGPWRLRILNGSASRIYDLAFPAGITVQMLGSDGGHFPSATPIEHLMLAPAERADLLVDFGAAAGRDVALSTRGFELPAGTFGPMGGRGAQMMRGRQGEAAEIMTFSVSRRRAAASGPLRLDATPLPTLPRGAREQRFVFSSMMMDHTINGHAFDMARRDIVSRAGTVERWTFVNDGPVPHPVHLHAAQFLVRERTGGRGRTFPWESGWKDTVLVLPSEVVTVDVHFGPHEGLFLLHCHNLVHEDMGMMLNVALEPRA